MKFIAKKYYTFSELQARWQCSPNDLKQALIDGELVSSFHMEPGNYVKYQFTPVDGGQSNWSYPCIMIDPFGHGDMGERREPRTGIYYLILPRRTGVSECEFPFFSSSPRGQSDGDICFSTERLICMSDVMENGVIEASEVERVEAMNAEDTTKSDLEKPLNTTERNSLLCIIAALCQDNGYDYNKAAKTARVILSTAAKMGFSIGETTIEEHLKKIPEALETRMK